MADKNYLHTAYANSADGTNKFSINYPKFNMLDGTKDFSGTWSNSDSWVTDGTYKGLTVKKRTGQWNGIYKTFTAPKDGTYTFSAYIKSSGNMANIIRFGGVNTTSSQEALQKSIGNNFDWAMDSITLNLKANDTAWIKYEISGTGTDSILWTSRHKWEQGSTATPHMPSASEVTTADYPQYKYVGRMAGLNVADKSDPKNYMWQSNTDVVRNQNGTALVKDLEVSGKLTRPNKNVLFAGAYWMQSGQVVTPSKSLSDCENGWLLHFTEYTSGMNQNTKNGQNHYCFIPKESATLGDVGISFPLAHSDGISTLKYLYVQGTKITGTGANETANSKKFVLQHVLEY